MATGTGDYKQLYYASRDGDLEQVKLFLADHDLNFLHPEFLTAPLHESIRNGHLAVSKFLLEQGANPNLREGYSDVTPLKIAQGINDQAAIELLKAHGVIVEEGFLPSLRNRISTYFSNLVKF
ncbi:MAG: ankyrin repeat domain-containing protein [Anaerolineae bacterium]